MMNYDDMKQRATMKDELSVVKAEAEPVSSTVPFDFNELWDADPNCKHDIKNAPGGGVKCTKCRGWCCY